jgi:hypothetical protein
VLAFAALLQSDTPVAERWWQPAPGQDVGQDAALGHVRRFHPWDELTSVEAVTEVLTRAGIDRSRVEYQPGTQRLDRPDDFWDIIMGTGYRATVDALEPQQQARLRTEVVGALRTAKVSSVRTDVVSPPRSSRRAQTSPDHDREPRPRPPSPRRFLVTRSPPPDPAGVRPRRAPSRSRMT